MTAVSGILQPIPGNGPFRMLDFIGFNIADAFVDP
jgi:hypothetical protein